jgi:hypothetical protein
MPEHRNEAADAYAKAASDYCKVHGNPVAVRKKKTDGSLNRDWIQWQDYFFALGMRGSVEYMNRSGVDEWIVPTQNPISFDEERALRAIEKADRKREADRKSRAALTPDRKRQLAEWARDAIRKSISTMDAQPKGWSGDAMPLPVPPKPPSPAVKRRLIEWDKLAVEARSKTLAGRQDEPEAEA